MRISRKIVPVMNKRPTFTFVLVLIFLSFIVLEWQLSTLKTENKKLRALLLNENKIRSLSNPSQSLNIKNGLGNQPIVVYNRVPKTGSTSFTHQVYALSKPNKFYVVHVNISANKLQMSLQDQYKMLHNMTTWEERLPTFYHGHFGYIPFNQFGVVEPLYINILREPLDRLISHYYFLRYGDNLRKGLRRVKQGDKTTFDECVAQQGHGCNPRELWLQIPMLCGQQKECWKVGSQWALNQAKYNLLNKYSLVGVSEQMEDFIVVLEALVPEMLKGLAKSYRTGKDSHIRNTNHKDPLSEETLSTMKSSKVYRMERELYDYALAQFEYIKTTSTFIDEDGLCQPRSTLFHYEKIYGPNGIIKTP